MRLVNQTVVINVIKHHLIHRFNLPETIMADQGTIFTGRNVMAFMAENNFHIIRSTLYYIQGNERAK